MGALISFVIDGKEFKASKTVGGNQFNGYAYYDKLNPNNNKYYYEFHCIYKDWNKLKMLESLIGQINFRKKHRGSDFAFCLVLFYNFTVVSKRQRVG